MRLLAWYDHNKRSLPWRVDQATSRDPWRTWVSEVMLQQTLIPVVIPAFNRFIAKFPDVFALARATEDDLRPVVKGLGYYRRFGMLHRAARIIAEISSDGNPIWPRTQEGWKALPGIGEYTSAAISSIAFDVPVPVIDGNVERVLCRLEDIRQPPNLPELKPVYRELATRMMANPAARARPGDFNQAMMELGQRVCTPSNPDCGQCPLSRQCKARKARTQHLAPAPKIRPHYEDVRLRLIVGIRVQQPGNHQVALFRRDEKQKFLKGTRGFWYGFEDPEGPPLSSSFVGSFKHSITKHKITADVHLMEVPPAKMAGTTCPLATVTKQIPDWIPAGDVENELISSLDSKAWRLILRRHQA
ncbi:A/G-specific adenine glycosylase [bacterium]|nr:A/G-specific adenine glycosylase [bacterium]